MSLSRRSFLKTTGAALATPAILLAQVEAPSPPNPAGQYGNQKNWFTTICQRTGGLVYRHGAHRSLVPTKRTRPHIGRKRNLRAGRSHRVAYHPLGQTLIVTADCGQAQREGGSIEEIHPGDVVWFPRGVKHWRGATPTTAMTHIAIQEALDGKVVGWMEKVSDEQYET
jgi:mannose-6-phosphate isomerase-like protein (cupin superfamily)